MNRTAQNSFQAESYIFKKLKCSKKNLCHTSLLNTRYWSTNSAITNDDATVFDGAMVD